MRIFFVLLLAFISNDPKEIAKINSLKKEAEQAYLSGDYKLAAERYRFLADSLEVDDDLVRLNLGHSLYHLGDSANAKNAYGKLGMSANQQVKSIAYQQLGVMSKDANKLEVSLQQLKSSIKADPTNKEAIYNYEVVKKQLEEQQQQQQDKDNKENEEQNEEQNKDQQNKDQENKDGDQENKDQKGENQDQSDQENKEQEQQEGEEEQKEGEQEEEQQEQSQEEMTKEKLQEMGISEEKARQLLEAMRQSEIKYLQNQKRKATKRPPSGKPDW